MPLSYDFWRNKRVLITGHTGFIGGWLYYWLHQMGAELSGYALPANSNPNFYNICGLGKIGTQQLGDIRDAAMFDAFVKKRDPQIVIHLAAQALVRPANKDPIDTFTTNVNGTMHLLQSMRECPNLQSAIIFTTDKVYENIEQSAGYSENDKLGGYEPYGASKACTEIVTQSFWHSYFKTKKIPFTTLRAGNVIGGGDWSVDRLIPDAIRAFCVGKPLVLRHPEAVRPWQHVLEPCYAILLMAQKMAGKNELFHYNIGPNDTDCQNVGWIADRMVAAWNRQNSTKVEWRHEPDNSIYEAGLLKLNNTKARTELGWHPRWTTEQAIEHTAAWYAAQKSGADMSAMTRTQIENFING